MIDFEAAPDHVIAARAEGKLTSEDIEAFTAEIDARLARHERIGLVTDVTALDGVTLDGIIGDFRAQFKYFGQWHRFPKVALIANEGFLKGMGETMAHLVPQVEIRVFPPEERAAAIAFAQEVDADMDGRGEAGGAA